jgi:hypothetical protein
MMSCAFWVWNTQPTPSSVSPTEMRRLVSIQVVGTGSGKLYQTTSSRLRLPCANIVKVYGSGFPGAEIPVPMEVIRFKDNCLTDFWAPPLTALSSRDFGPIPVLYSSPLDNQ